MDLPNYMDLYLQKRGFAPIVSGKVREVYRRADYLFMHTTDRVSAFNVVLPQRIPTKGQVLNQLNAHFQQQASTILSSWMLATPTASTMIGCYCVPFAVEFVVRGYLSGHAWRVYAEGGRNLCGEVLPEGLTQHDLLPCPIFTPTTKAVHDEDVTPDCIVASGLMTRDQLEQARAYVLALFEQGSVLARRCGLLLVDAKYELGLHAGRWYVLDELHTPDSARYFYEKGYVQRQQAGEVQPQLSKEALREWLIEQGVRGVQASLRADQVEALTQLYQRLYKQLLGRSFEAEVLSEDQWVGCMDRALGALGLV